MNSIADSLYFGEDILFATIEILLILRLYNHIYGEAKNSNIRLYWKAGLAIMLVSILLKIVLQPGRPAAFPPVTVFCSFLFLKKYPANIQKKILFSTLLITTAILEMVLADLILTPLQIQYFAPLLLHLIFWILLELIIKIGKYIEAEIPYSLWALLLSVTLSSIAVTFIMWYYIIRRENPYLLTSEIPVMLLLLFINVSLFVFFDKFSAFIQQAKEKVMLEQQLQMQNSHYKELEATHRQFQSIQHDMKNCLRTASQLAMKQEKNGELITYLNKVSGQIYEIEQVVSTGNENLDSVLNIKITEMKRDNIFVNTEIQVPPGIKFSFEQSVTILGNLLDNAKEACLKLPQDARWVYIKAQVTKHVLFIRIENSTNKVIEWKDGLPVSTKQARGVHGIGLRNIREIIGDAETINIEALPHCFQVRIVIYDI